MPNTVRELMTSNPSTVEAHTPVMEAAEIMRRDDVGPVPLVEGDKLVGIVTDRDIVLRVVAENRDAGATTCGEIASRQLVTVDPEQTLDEARRLMAEHQVRRLPVVEEDGKLVGILAQADVARQGGHDAKTGEMVEEISR